MATAHSKLTVKAQTTIPKAVREVLGLRAGDAIAYEIEGGCVTLRREGSDRACLKALKSTLSEWDSPEDADAYDDL